MKKLIVSVLLFVLFVFTGCESATTTTTLTAKNYKDFLVVEYRIENCNTTQKSDLFGVKTVYHCTVLVTTKAKNNAKFEDAKIRFSISCGSNYSSSGKYYLYLDENGKSSTSVTVESTYGYPKTNLIKFYVSQISGNITY